MQKFLPILLAVIFVSACRKEKLPPREDSSQQLKKIVKKTVFGSGVEYSETIAYEFDRDHRIITEGVKQYSRDQQGRITRISYNTNVIDVHYKDPLSKEVAYTLFKFQAKPTEFSTVSLNMTDSTVYEHTNGKVSSIKLFSSSDISPVTLTAVYHFSYDAGDNLQKVVLLSVNNNNFTVCGVRIFDQYDNKPNPLYSDDEVRLLNFGWEVTNVSSNNFLTGNSAIRKSYQYRSDGRPSSCAVSDVNGNTNVLLTYHYE